MKFLAALVLFAAPAFAAYTGAPWAPMKSEVKLRQILVDRSSLRDPFSVQFRGVQVRETKGENADTTWCGEINGKNAMGAYSGWRPFYVMEGLKDGPIVGIVSPDDSSEAMMLSMLCKGSRLSPAE